MPADLFSSPRSRAQDLGLPMPDDLHAVSACLPLWEHNVGYEEGDPAVIDQLQAAYPRFCFHPFINQLSDRDLNHAGYRGLPFATQAAARRAQAYVIHSCGSQSELVAFPGQAATGVVVPEQHFSVLKQYWQHAGENVSSRVAEQILNGETATAMQTIARQTVRSRVADIQQTNVDGVFLYSSGMAAIAAVWRAANKHRGAASCQFGFPYVDTLKIQQRFEGAGCRFFPLGAAADMKKLASQCETTPPNVIFCEVPTNPLLYTPDVVALRALADQHDIVLVIDDTLGACGNVQALPYADIVVTSLTKYFSGIGNVLAGSAVVNPASRHADTLKQLLSGDFEETLSDVDVEVLCRNSADFRERTAIINANAAQLADYLRSHPRVLSVFYPQENDINYERLKSPTGGYGGLLSIVLRDAEAATPAVFDSLNVCKGPNLGTNFTLCCPYTILAHYTELDFAEQCGVSRWLLRVSVGVEDINDLVERFEAALKTEP